MLEARQGLTVLPMEGASHVLEQHRATDVRYRPEENPFETILVDLTHRCNMLCRNCYIPNREIPDLNADWLVAILGRLPRRTRIRLAGAEPTLRPDLPELIRRIRGLRHWPVLLTNGLKLAQGEYARELRRSGLRVCYLSFNGGFSDAYYEAIDDLACAAKKRLALENLARSRFYIALGIIVVRGINEPAVGEVFRYALEHPPVREIKIRSVGALGRHMAGRPYALPELVEVFRQQTGASLERAQFTADGEYLCQFRRGRLKIQMTQWPDLGSKARGRLAPDGTIQPFFEHVLANEGGY